MEHFCKISFEIFVITVVLTFWNFVEIKIYAYFLPVVYASYRYTPAISKG